MTTSPVHNLSQELITHILRSAYLEYDDPAAAGQGARPALWQHKQALAAAALVHPSWRGPAQALLTQDLAFDVQQKSQEPRERLRLLVDQNGPAFACARLELGEFRQAGAMRLLARIAARSVRELRFQRHEDGWEGDLFGAPALSDLRRLVVAGPLTVPAWPSSLTHFSYDINWSQLGRFPAAAVLPSAATLRSLHLMATDASQLSGFSTVASKLVSLNELSICWLTIRPTDPVPASLVAAAHAVPPTASLTLHGLSPQQVAPVLARIPGNVRLRELTTVFDLPFHLHKEYRPNPTLVRWTDGVALCASQTGLARVARWRLAIRSLPNGRDAPSRPVSEQELIECIFDNMAAFAAGEALWGSMRAAMEAQGCEVVVGGEGAVGGEWAATGGSEGGSEDDGYDGYDEGYSEEEGSDDEF